MYFCAFVLDEVADELLFAPAQGMEARKEHRATLPDEPLLAAGIGQGAVTLPGIGELLAAQLLAKVGVDLVEHLPETEEVVLLPAGAWLKGAPEGLEEALLLLAQEVKELVDLLLALQIVEEVFGIDQLLVYLVKVTQEHFAPVVKAVKAVLAGHILAVDFEELKDLLQAVGHGMLRELVYKLLHAQDGGRPDGAAEAGGEVLAEEEARTAVGEDHGELVYLLPVGGNDMLCEIVKEGAHEMRSVLRVSR